MFERAFLLLWCVLAVGLGTFFLVRPQIVYTMYRAMMGVTKVTDRLREELAPERLGLVVYRVGGGFFLVTGLLVGFSVLSGRLP